MTAPTIQVPSFDTAVEQCRDVLLNHFMHAGTTCQRAVGHIGDHEGLDERSKWVRLVQWDTQGLQFGLPLVEDTRLYLCETCGVHSTSRPNCGTCGIWLARAGGTGWVVTDTRAVYSIGRGGGGGFGGATFRVTLTGQAPRTTTDLWFAGTVPEHLAHLYPVNALVEIGGRDGSWTKHWF